ncbi:zinc finger MYND domain-containing protein 15 isoform X1, partial [Lates japonicus]
MQNTRSTVTEDVSNLTYPEKTEPSVPDLNLLKKQTLRIHILESYREFHTMLTFWELSLLLPHVTFELVFIGGHLPGWCDKVLHHFFIQKI